MKVKLQEEGVKLRNQIKELEAQEEILNTQLLLKALEIPNRTHPDSPVRNFFFETNRTGNFFQLFTFYCQNIFLFSIFIKFFS